MARDSRAYKALVKRLRATLPPFCWLCGGDIDLSLSNADRMAWTADHVIPISQWPEGELVEENIRPAHRICNSQKGEGGWGDAPKQPAIGSQNWG